LKEEVINMLRKLDSLYFMAKYKLHAFLTDEEGDVNIVSMVVLIGMAVLLAIVFKNQIKNLIETLVGQITTRAGTAITTGE